MRCFGANSLSWPALQSTGPRRLRPSPNRSASWRGPRDGILCRLGDEGSGLFGLVMLLLGAAIFLVRGPLVWAGPPSGRHRVLPAFFFCR